ncbi:MAG: hypothetical protein LBS84_12815 [Clostridiales bacterium]|jgi:Mor family transcriptional regulator|nr:hypothetical protein [Clostridiales bacterium]
MDKQQMREIVTRYKEYLPETAETLLDILGYDGLCELSAVYGGSSLYIPKRANLFVSCLQQSMVDEYNGLNSMELSKKYGVCRRTLQRAVSRNINAGKHNRATEAGAARYK